MRAFRLAALMGALIVVFSLGLIGGPQGRRAPSVRRAALRPVRLTAHRTRQPLHSSARPLWSVRLSSDGRAADLAYRGVTWISGLQVKVVAGDNRLSSMAPGVSLAPTVSRVARRTVYRVRGPAPYDIVFDTSGPSVEVSLHGFPQQGQAQAVLEGQINAGPEPIQARLHGQGSSVWQMESGPATSRLNDCVYNRFRDQALRVLARQTRFTAVTGGFRVIAAGPLGQAPRCRFEMVSRVFSRRLPFYAPLDKQMWPHAPVGWCSWYNYFARVKEKDILSNADALAAYYKPFGLSVCLIDAGWQHAGNGEHNSPIGGNWDASNLKFPHGMKWMADQIHARGLKAGLWLAVFGNADRDFYERHADWFLHDASGNAKLGTWFGTYVADFSNPRLEEYLYNVYRRHTLDWGYDYYKLDGENDTRDIWARNRARADDPTLDPNAAFRQALSRIRLAMDSKPGVFFSACGPAYPTEAMGIAQSARLGGDVVGDGEPPSFRGVRTALAGMRRGYYTNNIAWYTDPDVLVVRPPLTRDEARTWATVLGLTGQLLMLGDDVAALPPSRREIVRKVMPVADITPMDLFPISHDRPIWMLHIVRPFGSWDVAGIFNWDVGPDEMPPGTQPEAFDILNRDDALLKKSRTWGGQLQASSFISQAEAENRRLQALAQKPRGLELLPAPAFLTPPAPRKITLNFSKAGLDPHQDYLLFDFWNQKFLGKARGQYSVRLKPHQCEVVSLRPNEHHPQLIGTDRHITMGGVELRDEKWDPVRKQLRVVMSLVEHYPTVLTFYTNGSRFAGATAPGASVSASVREEVVRVTLLCPVRGPRAVVLQFR
jgi:hypothetical protein